MYSCRCIVEVLYKWSYRYAMCISKHSMKFRKTPLSVLKLRCSPLLCFCVYKYLMCVACYKNVCLYTHKTIVMEISPFRLRNGEKIPILCAPPHSPASIFTTTVMKLSDTDTNDRVELA
jgi:hypothetical protein